MRVSHRRRERRTAMSVIAVVAGVVLAAGCGGEQPGPAPAGSSASTAPTATGSGAPLASVERPHDGDLVARLRRGGHVIYIRHAATESTQDDPRPDLADPSTQRNLSNAGREQARQLGRAMRQLGVPIGDVLVSPYARTRETAELAFGAGRVRATRDLLNEAFPGTDDEALARALRRLLTTRPPAGFNTVLVSHGFNLQGATGLSIREGESAVFEHGGGGRPLLVARFTVEQWQALARQG